MLLSWIKCYNNIVYKNNWFNEQLFRKQIRPTSRLNGLFIGLNMSMKLNIVFVDKMLIQVYNDIKRQMGQVLKLEQMDYWR